MSPIPPVRLRARFSKLGKIKFTSHRDTARMWERALRRAEMPIAYTEGFSPRPKVHFGLALRTGYASYAEFLDIDHLPGTEIDVVAVCDRLTDCLPAGLTVTAAETIDPVGADSLQEMVTSCTYEMHLAGHDDTAVADAVSWALAADEIPVTRIRKGKEKTADLRPTLHHLGARRNADGVLVLEMELGTQPRGFRPDELTAAMGLGEHPGPVWRTMQIIQTEGERREPLALRPPQAIDHQVQMA